MARYCEAKDLRALVPDMFRDAALADSSGGAEADAGLLKAVLDGACEEVDALIEGRVRLPLETVPAKLRVAAANIAMELLFIRRGRPLPEPAAEKVRWWRSWLSKVGEGELRLEAPETAGKTEYPGAVATRPGITGSGRLLFALAVSFGIWAFGRAESLAVEARSWAFALPASGDVFENPEEMEWSQGENLVLEYYGGRLEAGQVARWEVVGGTNLWIDAEPAGEAPAWRWALSPEGSALPAGRYSGRVAVYSVDGGTTTFHRVAALQGIRVHAGVEGLDLVAPLVTGAEWVAEVKAATNWMSKAFATTGEVAAVAAGLAAQRAEHAEDMRGIAMDVATNAAAIAELEDAAGALGTATNALDGRVSALEGATNHLSESYAEKSWVEVYVAENAPQPDLGGYVAKTNGAWVIVQGEAWNGIEWEGERIFGAVLQGTDGGMAAITSLTVVATNSLRLGFRGAATNYLEGCNDYTNWSVWNDVTWEYTGPGTGTATVTNASPEYWYRVVAAGEVFEATNAAVVSYAPLFAGGLEASNRVATLGDLSKTSARQSRSAGASGVPVTKIWRDGVPFPGEEERDWAWNFAGMEPYIRSLKVGGQVVTWEETEQEGGVTVTNTHSCTNSGSLELNGERITSFSQIAQYAEGADVIVEVGVESVNGEDGALRIAGGTNIVVETGEGTGEITIHALGSGVSSINGLTGNFLIVNGAGISVSTNTMAGYQVVTISATDTGGGGGESVDMAAVLAAVATNDFPTFTLGGVERCSWPSGGGGGAWTPASRVVTATNAAVLADDYLVWLDGSELGSEETQVLDLPDMEAESMTVVVRHLGSAATALLRRVTAATTNTYQLAGDGASVAVDWLGARTNWYWRQAY